MADLRTDGVDAWPIGNDVAIRVEIDMLLARPVRFWRWIMYRIVKPWDVYIAFSADRFLRNVEVECRSERVPSYVCEAVSRSLGRVGCIELVDKNDELKIALRVGSGDHEIAALLATIHGAESRKYELIRNDDFVQASKLQRREMDAREQLDRVLFAKAGL